VTTNLQIAMVSEHASPLATIGGVDSGGQNVHVAALSLALGRRGHEVTVYTRRDSTSLPERLSLGPGVTVVHLPAGPPTDIPKDELLPYMGEFVRELRERWSDSGRRRARALLDEGAGLAAAARDLDVPVVPDLPRARDREAAPPGRQGHEPVQRLRIERAIARDVAAIVATLLRRGRELARMGVRRDAVTVVPSASTSSTSPRTGRSAPGDQRFRLLVVGRLVERKGVDDAIRALSLVRTPSW
jgi:glycosyltransferase involved in cell wall biosynthesis